MKTAGDSGTAAQRHGQETGVLLIAAALILGVAGCRGLGGVRPRLVPLPGSVVRTVDIPADSATRALAAALLARHVPVTAVAPAEGYVESVWYDLENRAPRWPETRRLESIVKLRFFADPAAGRTRVVGEVVRRVLVDPSVPERELERIVPEGHAGRTLLGEVMTSALGVERPPQQPGNRN